MNISVSQAHVLNNYCLAVTKCDSRCGSAWCGVGTQYLLKPQQQQQQQKDKQQHEKASLEDPLCLI